MKLCISLIAFLFFFNINAQLYFSNDSYSVFSGPLTISLPGVYRLSQNITGPITIAASNVYLDFEGRVLTGNPQGIIISGQTDIEIKNGTIQNSAQAGVNLSQCRNIKISDMDFVSNVTSVFAVTSTQIFLSNCIFTGLAAESVISTLSCNNIIFNDSLISNNTRNPSVSPLTTLIGVNIDTASDVFLKNVLVSENTVTGLYAFSIINSRDVLCLDCTVGSNVTQGIFRGFSLTNNESSQFENCFVISNTALSSSDVAGFFISNSNAAILKNCFVTSNTLISPIGFTPIFNGFMDDATSRNNIFDSCRAVSNGSNSDCHGFQIRSSVGSIINCIAQGNTCGIGSVSFWLNGARAITVRGNLAESAFGPNVFGFLYSPGSGVVFTQNQSQGFIRPPGINQNYSGISAGAISTYDLITYNAGAQLPASLTNLSITVT